MGKHSIWLMLSLFLILVFGFTYRVFAVQQLPIDYDEDDYLAASQRYAHALRNSDLDFITNYSFNSEHPPLSKILFAAVITQIPEASFVPETDSSLPPVRSLPYQQLKLARMVSVVLGTLEVIALAVFDPLAGFLLALNSWHVKYTSQIMLEPLPSLMSLLSVLFYIRSKRKNLFWLSLSALAMSITAASKFTYCVAGLAIIADWLWASLPNHKPYTFQKILAWLAPVYLWGMIVFLIFLAVNPRMWIDPFKRLSEIILFHGSYAQSAHVKETGLPFWQPLVWLFNPATFNGNPFLLPTDAVIALLAIFGLRKMGRKNAIFTWWLGIGLVFLLVWPTKWPQYILTITAPLCVAASQGFHFSVWMPLKKVVSRKQEEKISGNESVKTKKINFRETRRAVPWLIPGTIILGLLAIYPIIFQFAMSLTDFSVYSIIDGIRGGVWRAVAQGLTGLENSVQVEVFGRTPIQNQVHYSGFSLLLQLFLGAAASPLVFNVLWTVTVVACQAILGVVLALVLNQKWVKFRGFWIILFILPWAIPEFVSALVWLRLLAPHYGWLSQIASMPADISIPVWYENLNSAFFAALLAGTWVGFPMIFLATLGGQKMISPDVYDAAAIDGASSGQTIREITIPLLLPLLLPVILVRVIFSFNQFYLFFVLGFPFPITTLSNVAFTFFSPLSGFGGKFAVAASINIFALMILLVMVIWFNKLTRLSESNHRA